MKNLEKFGVQELTTVEVEKIDGGKIGWRDLVAFAMFYLDNFDPSVLPTGELGGYTGCKP